MEARAYLAGDKLDQLVFSGDWMHNLMCDRAESRSWVKLGWTSSTHTFDSYDLKKRFFGGHLVFEPVRVEIMCVISLNEYVKRMHW